MKLISAKVRRVPKLAERSEEGVASLGVRKEPVARGTAASDRRSGEAAE
jgi:hypothetical protein